MGGYAALVAEEMQKPLGGFRHAVICCYRVMPLGELPIALSRFS